ncbi:uncharacterized protein LOC116903774 [Rattus rattus]|uniref:uncharacterized protein LOC116903774 n=1 Tax=Rattus rattus TaxID=10117 RepID=UPI0013F337E1|nr:uncharacterized protein LOC116903774 [Rattus rattus]
MAASRILLVLLSISLLALNSAQRTNENDENSPQDQEALEEGDANQQNGGIHTGLNEIKNHLQHQLNQHDEEGIKPKRGKNGQGGNRRSAGDSLGGQDRQSGNQRGGGGQGGHGHSGQIGQKGKGVATLLRIPRNIRRAQSQSPRLLMVVNWINRKRYNYQRVFRNIYNSLKIHKDHPRKKVTRKTSLLLRDCKYIILLQATKEDLLIISIENKFIVC